MNINFKKNKRPEPENEDWQLTLADMMILLLCFFVLIVAISSVDSKRYQAMSAVMGAAMGMEKARTDQEKKKSLMEIKHEIERIIGSGYDEIRLELRPNAMAINLRAGVLFESGKADLTDRAKALLKRISEPLMGIEHHISV